MNLSAVVYDAETRCCIPGSGDWARGLEHCAGFDTEKFYLGSPCHKGHGADSGQNLRYKANWMCVECHRERKRGAHKTPEQLFWEKVDKDGPVHPTLKTPCWVWTGSTSGKGYGEVRVKRRLWRAHRYSWAIVNGSIPDELLVCHECDNPPCVNPSHLFVGTSQQNTDDMRVKGRANYVSGLRGSDLPQARLTEEAVRELRAKYAEGGYTQSDLAIEYGIKQAQVSSIVRRTSWRHI